MLELVLVQLERVRRVDSTEPMRARSQHAGHARDDDLRPERLRQSSAARASARFDGSVSSYPTTMVFISTSFSVVSLVSVGRRAAGRVTGFPRSPIAAFPRSDEPSSCRAARAITSSSREREQRRCARPSRRGRARRRARAAAFSSHRARRRGSRSRSQTRSRTSGEPSPIPAVNTSASRPPSAAAIAATAPATRFEKTASASRAAGSSDRSSSRDVARAGQPEQTRLVLEHMVELVDRGWPRAGAR